MPEADFWHTNLHSFNLRLKGWNELRERESLERWQIARRQAWYTIPGGNWKQTPDLLREWPLPGDVKPASKGPSPEEIREQLRKAKEVWGLKLSPGLNKMVDAPPNPENPEKPNTDAQPA